MADAPGNFGPPDVLVVASSDRAEAIRQCLQGVDVRLRYTEDVESDESARLSARPDLALFPRPKRHEAFAEQLRILRDRWPDLPVVVTGSGFDERVAAALASRDTGFVTQSVLSQLVSAVERAVRFSDERTRRREAETRVEIQNSELAALVDTAPDPIAQFDSDSRYIYVNRALVRLTGKPPETYLGASRSDTGFPPVDAGTWRSTLRSVFEQGGERKLSFRYPVDDGHDLHFEARLAAETMRDGTVRSVVLVARDVTERHLRERRIEYLARHDPLTGLPNRRVLRERIEASIHRADRGHPSTLLFADVDDFKSLNDEAGHDAGDRFLVELSDLMRDAVRPTDVVARIGGDEFVVLLEEAGPDEGREVAERLVDAASRYEFVRGDLVFRAALTVGAVVVDRSLPDEKAVDEYLRRAELAMRRGKESGKARLLFFRPEWRDGPALAESSEWLTRIRAGLAGGRFEVHLQPILYPEAADPPPTFEALVRLREDGELLVPSQFLRYAERFGLITDIDEWMLDAVLGLPGVADGTVRIAVNLSGPSLGVVNVAERLLAVHPTDRLERRGLMVEITETAAVHRGTETVAWMDTARDAGASFVLDDFGTGFASFSHLRRFPVDAVKIDGWLVNEVRKDSSRRAVVRAMVEVCHALGREVVAEWIQDRATLETLLSLGVDGVQGTHVGDPRPAEEALAGLGRGEGPGEAGG